MVESETRAANVRKIHHSVIFLSNRKRVASVSLNVRWNRQASRRLLSASARAYKSISAGSVRGGFAVRTYLRISGLGSGASEMACIILETWSLISRTSARIDTAR